MLKILMISEYLGEIFTQTLVKFIFVKFDRYSSDTDMIDSIQISKHKNRYPVHTVNRYTALPGNQSNSAI